ncbi:MAG TPA: HAD-IA family hydrolase [Burkholderiales bacterium]|nr:HAD-IA family hydrolase [Burkholderiales bacterium]
MNGVRAVLFDLDGTFADTAADLARALNHVRTEQGLAPLPPEVARPHTSSGARGLLKAGFGVTPESENYRALRERFLDFYEQELCVETRLFDGIPELLVKIRARKLPWGIVTNKGKRFTEPLLRHLAVDNLAACVVSGDSTPHIKPHPEPLLLAASLLKLPPADCIYIGDDLRDVQAARAAGMRFAAAGWGYLGDGADPSTWGADAVISHPREVMKLIV